MAVLGFAICATAAYRLAGTPLPLFATAAGVAATNLACSCWRSVVVRTGGTIPRPITALQHVTAALGGFFLFVSFALP